MITGANLVIAIAVMSAVTILTRALPFIIFGSSARKPPAAITYLGNFLPPAIICVILVYCFSGVSLFAPPYAWKEAIAVAAVAGLYLWKPNPIISIFAGTAVYMALTQLIK